MFSSIFSARWKESPRVGIGGRRLSGGSVSGAGTGGASSGISLELEKVLSGVVARCEVGVTLRSGNLPGALGIPFMPPRDRGGKLEVSSRLPNDSWLWFAAATLLKAGWLCWGVIESKLSLGDSILRERTGLVEGEGAPTGEGPPIGDG
jgi:hypothetical protein